jgi:hypothetical protein
VIGASGLSDDDDGKNDRLKWKLAESVRQQNNIFTASPLSSFSKWVRKMEAFREAFIPSFSPPLAD